MQVVVLSRPRVLAPFGLARAEKLKKTLPRMMELHAPPGDDAM
jgi:hypothetical protein